MAQEKIITLNKYIPRNYQLPIFDAIENKGYKRVIVNAARRSGKDITAWNIAIRQCLRKTCLVYYCLPTFSQAKRTVWDAISIDGIKFIDFIPKEVIDSINSQEMKIRFKNNSLLQLIGGDTYNTSLVGTNPYGLVLSEYALMDPQAFEFARPILAANDGWCLILSTPRGHNSFFDMWSFGQAHPETWFCYQLSIHDTHHISEENLALEKAAMSPELFAQEFEVSFSRGVDGAFYAKHLDDLRRKNQIGFVDWNPSLKTHVSWDLGVADKTVLLFFQIEGNKINIIDCVANTNVGLDWYAKELQKKPYIYGKHLGPHDLRVRSWSEGAITRIDKARDLGIDFTIVPNISIDDGIEAVWTSFNRFWIDEVKCKPLIHALESYHREWDEKFNRYRDKPVHDSSSDFADALRYLCLGLPHVSSGLSKEELNEAKQRALYGQQSNLPKPLQDHPSNGWRW